MRDLIVRTTGGERAARGSHPLLGLRGAGTSGSRRLRAPTRFFVMISAGLGYPDTWYSQGLRMMTTT